MARSSTTLDPFNAIAEPKRREVLDALSRASSSGSPEVPVNDLVHALGWPQPQVSKHLAVLREVGIVAVRRRGRERLYSINGHGLKTIHDWTAMFDKFWTHQLDRIKQHAEAQARQGEPASAPASPARRARPPISPPSTNHKPPHHPHKDH